MYYPNILYKKIKNTFGLKRADVIIFTNLHRILRNVFIINTNKYRLSEKKSLPVYRTVKLTKFEQKGDPMDTFYLKVNALQINVSFF